MNTPLPQQAVPPRPSKGGVGRILMIIGGVFVLGALALAGVPIAIAQSEGPNSGAAEAAGFAFMGALCPCAIGGSLFIWGVVAWTNEHARRQREQGM